MEHKKDLLYRYKKLYEKEVKSYSKHNLRVRLSHGKINRYLELLEEERKAKREKKHYSWVGSQAVVKKQKSYIHLSDLPYLTYDIWVNRLPLQVNDMIFIEKHFDLIYAYIGNNHAEVFSKSMINMYNPQVLQMFLLKYKENPFPLQMKSYWTDLYIDGDAYENLRFDLCHYFEKSHGQDPTIGQALTQAII